MQRVAVLDPPKQTSVGRKRDDREPLDVETSLEAVRVHRQQAVDEAEQLHHPLVLPQVFVALE